MQHRHALHAPARRLLNQPPVANEADRPALRRFRTRKPRVRALGAPSRTSGAGRKPGRRRAVETAAPERTRAAPPIALAYTAHELRTPLNGLIAMLDTLHGTCTDARQKRLVELGRMAGDHLVRLLDGILDATPAAAAGQEPFDLWALCRDTYGFWNESARGKGLRLDLILDADLPVHVRGNPLRLRQVLFNLLANALKFTPRGRVLLRVRRQHDAAIVRFTVEDSGVGIAADEQAGLFRPYRRARAARRAGYSGVGLGLAISQELVHAMGGRIALRSRVGAGTCVTVDLPLPRARTPLATSHAPIRASRRDRLHDDDPPAPRHALALLPIDHARERQRGRLILLAEDNPIARELIGLQLAQLGHAHDTATDGLDALRQLRARQYGLLLTDVRMTGMNGAALARHVRRAGLRNIQGEPLPVVAFSAGRPALAGATDRRPGFNEWLTKPVPQAELAACLDRWLPPKVR
ncbi:ATP-binding protein [Bordetella genomosp. 13]|uniref:ATP-binding protein n=1 Tax=Bordetella genomosp. 13 TaxID=463040 RepID=UPI0011A30BD5|nr:ATP-binding protein [Bordetella genomosp. 13]